MLGLDEYLKKYTVASRSFRQTVPVNVFVSRQKLELPSQEPSPPLRPFCLCNAILNPDEPVIQCTTCGIYAHVDCMVSRSIQTCTRCKASLPIVASESPVSPAKKRALPEDPANPPGLEGLKRIASDRGGLPPLERMASSGSRNAPEASFPNLSKERAEALTFLIKRLEKQEESNLEQGGSTQRYRGKARQKFVNALVRPSATFSCTG